MELNEEATQRIVNRLADAISSIIKNDPILAHEIMMLIELGEKESAKREWPFIQKCNEIGQQYEGDHYDKIKPEVLAMLQRKAGGEDRLFKLMHLLGRDGVLGMPAGYQIKVMNTSIKRGSYKPFKSKGVSSVDHGATETDYDDLAAFEERASGAV